MKNIITQNHYDTAVIGGGPSGIIAAARSAECGARTILIEKNNQCGKKLLITGKGRCNITNAEPDLRQFISVFGKKGKFLYPALHLFSNQDIIDLFHKYGLETKTERGQRVFPVSDDACSVLNTLLQYLNGSAALLLKNSPVINICSKNSHIEKLILTDSEITSDNYILCTGGLSYPQTGSTGSGYQWAKELGHTVITPEPGLIPVYLKEKWIKELAGLSLKNVRISVIQNNKKMDEQFGEALFTHEGISGPIILDLSTSIRALIKKGMPVFLHIDLKPALDFPVLDKRILRDFQSQINKTFKNSLDELLPQSLIPVIIKLSNIDPDKKVNTVTKEERNSLLHLLKELTVTVEKLFGFEKAIITSGGIALDEIDPKTMRSKIIDNLYFAGEILDLDGPTGGYNLQVSWSTGYLAGQSAAEKK